MNRLTAQEFIKKMSKAPSWVLSKNIHDELELTVSHGPGDVEIYLGPYLPELSAMEAATFLFCLKQAGKPTKSDVDLTLPRLDISDFLFKMRTASKWMIELHVPERCYELIVLTARGGEFNRYLSLEFDKMPPKEFDYFLVEIERLKADKK